MKHRTIIMAISVFMLSNLSTLQFTKNKLEEKYDKKIKAEKVSTFNNLLYQIQRSCETAWAIQINGEEYLCVNYINMDKLDLMNKEDKVAKEDEYSA